jgi:phytoene synthase
MNLPATSAAVDSRQVLALHARSFRWGAAFLSGTQHDDAAILYAFCRYSDDAVDEAPSHDVAQQALDALEAGL